MCNKILPLCMLIFISTTQTWADDHITNVELIVESPNMSHVTLPDQIDLGKVEAPDNTSGHQFSPHVVPTPVEIAPTDPSKTAESYKIHVDVSASNDTEKSCKKKLDSTGFNNVLGCLLNGSDPTLMNHVIIINTIRYFPCSITTWASDTGYPYSAFCGYGQENDAWCQSDTEGAWYEPTSLGSFTLGHLKTGIYAPHYFQCPGNKGTYPNHPPLSGTTTGKLEVLYNIPSDGPVSAGNYTGTIKLTVDAPVAV